jgi:hypothetical protein
MTFQVTDRIKEVSTTSGTGTFTLANTVVAGFLRFSDIPGVANGDVVPYCAVDTVPTPAVWEVGYGTYNLTAHTLARTAVISNSLGTKVAVTFANVPSVFLTETSGLVNQLRPLIAGRYYMLPGSTGGLGGVPALKVMMTPYYVPNPIALATLSLQLGASVSTCAMYLGIATDNAGSPGTLLAQANQTIGAGNANSVVTLSVPVFLVPGWYWIVSSFNGGVNASTYNVAVANSNYGSTPMPDFTGATTVANATAMNTFGYYSTDATGATLPTTFTGLAVNPSTYAPPMVVLGF